MTSLTFHGGGVLINGGSRGIGAALVRAFCAAGLAVAFTYKNAEKQAQALAKETGAFAILADTASYEEVQKAVKQAEEKVGFISVYINNAAVSAVKLFTDVTPSEWENMRGVNLDGALYYSQAVLPAMIARKTGRMINMSSVWGEVGASCEVHYSATKAALLGLTRALAKEVGPSGITVNAIAPGVIDTEMNGHLTEEEKNTLVEETPLCRLGTVNDVANAALFLASRESAFITGQTLGVNGGFGV
ncbi:MAG: SDR family oxidoreductase [Clostridia bacterium]|nr:SDR family oxidoreductase [Clostridia bacterium]